MKVHRKMHIGALLIAFWSIILVSQVTNLKPQNPKFNKAAFNKGLSKGPFGSLTNDNQGNPIDTEEEEEDDDDFNLESTLPSSLPQEANVVRYYIFQDDLIRDPHREIFSPPPQA